MVTALLLALGFLAYSVYDAWRGHKEPWVDLKNSRSYYWATWLLAISILGLLVLSVIYWDGWIGSVVVVAYLASLAIQVRILMGIDRTETSGESDG